MSKATKDAGVVKTGGGMLFRPLNSASRQYSLASSHAGLG